jgi:hypothetical protein
MSFAENISFTENTNTNNIELGFNVLQNITSGIGNIGAGLNALAGVTGGSNNIGIGRNAGQLLVSSSGIVILGGYNGAGVTANTGTVVLADGTGNIKAVFTDTGALSLGTGLANFGTSGQVLLSNGPGSAPSWGSPSFGTTNISSTASSTSTTTGALTVAGGVGIGGNLWLGGTVLGWKNTQNKTITIANNDGDISTPSTTLNLSNPAGSNPTASTINMVSWTGGTLSYISAVNGSPGITVYGFGGVSLASANANSVPALYVQGGSNSTPYPVLIHNTSSGPTTNSNALQVFGGIGVVGNVYAQGQVYSNGVAVGGAPYIAPLGQFNTNISNQIGYSVADKLFDGTGYTTNTNVTTIIIGSTATVGVAAIMPSTTGTRYIVHSVYITNIAATDAEITGRFDHTQGFGGTSTQAGSLIDHTSLFASRLPVPTGSAVELLKKPQVLYPNDWIRLQSTTPSGGGGVSGQLSAYIVYESITDFSFTGAGINLSSTSPTNVYVSALQTGTTTATSFPSVIESVRITNYSNAADYRCSVIWTNSAGVTQGYLAYNMLIPAYAQVELLERPKRISTGDIIKAVPEASNVLSIQVSGRLLFSASS